MLTLRPLESHSKSWLNRSENHKLNDKLTFPTLFSRAHNLLINETQKTFEYIFWNRVPKVVDYIIQSNFWIIHHIFRVNQTDMQESYLALN